MSFEPVTSSFEPVALEERVQQRWRERDVFHESLRRREGAPTWVFYEGPPTANGRPGLHHVLARSFKDLFPRFQTMRGRYVPRKGGWDCHGLPVEVAVEKELGFSGKPQIEDYGIEAFNQRCRESVHRYVEDWSALTSRIGMWLDTADAYWTLDNEFIETVWWLFHEMWDRELIYEGFKVVPYCGRCGTALSSHELGQPGAYRDVTEPSVYVRFPVVDRDFDLLVWTTTPWTLVSNVAAAVGPGLDYVRVRGRDGRRDLVMAAGIVHLAPAFGEVDREVAEREGLPVLNPVGPSARFDDEVPPYTGRFVKDADSDLIDELAASGRLEAVVDYTHSYPHCWRCGTPLIYWAKPTWFARTAANRDALLRENEAIGWHPEHIKHGRFGDWLENNVDWALSRDRFWGTPIPVWRCRDCNADTCVGSVADLSERAGSDLSHIDLHRPYVDDVVIACDSCGGRAFRVEPVLDAWFDSGSMPAAQFHYPFEHRDLFEARFPADFICEAIDQTRGWFYSLLAVNTLVFDRASYRNVVCLGLIVAGDGQKMSKSRGNVIDPWAILDTKGADALRWNLFSAGSPWTTRRVSEAGIDESTRRFLLTLWNTYSFFVTYANIDGWAPGATAAAPTHALDRWARSRLHVTVREVTEALDDFDVLRGAQALDAFVDDLSNWYVRRSRPRFWRDSDSAAHTTLHECLVTLARLLAPFCPFIADEIYGNLSTDTDSVHLADWPEVDAAAIDAGLDAEMSVARQVVSLGRAARIESRLKVRQPLRRALVLLPSGAGVLSPGVNAEVADELNVKRLEPIADLEGLLEFEVVPNFRALGPRAGPRMPKLKEALAAADGAAVRRALVEDGAFSVEVDGESFSLGPTEVEVRAVSHEELALAQEGLAAVALDTVLDDELRREGIAREVVRALNELRKATGLEIADRITLELRADGVVKEALERHQEWIAGEVLAEDLRVRPLDGAADVDGFVSLSLDAGAVAASIERVEQN
jgi:isoleucyl-tRNA synthetase